MPLDTALKRYTINKNMKLQLVKDDQDGRIEKREKLSIQDFDIAAKARQLSNDYERPTFLADTLPHRATKLTLSP